MTSFLDTLEARCTALLEKHPGAYTSESADNILALVRVARAGLALADHNATILEAGCPACDEFQAALDALPE